jgi:hypothetical protein
VLIDQQLIVRTVDRVVQHRPVQPDLDVLDRGERPVQRQALRILAGKTWEDNHLVFSTGVAPIRRWFPICSRPPNRLGKPVEPREFEPLPFCMPCMPFRLTVSRWVRLLQFRAVMASGDVWHGQHSRRFPCWVSVGGRCGWHRCTVSAPHAR